MNQTLPDELRKLARTVIETGTVASRRARDMASEAARKWGDIWSELQKGLATPPAPSGSRPTREAIAARAYQVWMNKGCPAGTAEQDWLEAERQIRLEASRPAEQCS